MKKELEKLLDTLEKEKIILSYMGEHKIADRINQLFQKDERCTDEETAERIAFDFIENYQSDLDWETYYGPKFIFPLENDKTKVKIYPHISQINEKIIKYWEKRAEETQNQVLKLRYADLVVDFKLKILQERAIKFYDIVIKSTIEICKQGLADDLSCQTKLKRAFQLELETKKEISSDLKREIVNLDKKGEFNKPGTWGFAFELLVLNKIKKIKITKKEKEELFNNILDKFNRADKNSHILEYTTSLLASFFVKEKKEKELVDILLKFEEKYKKTFDTLDEISKAHAYQNIIEMFYLYSNYSQKIRVELGRIVNEVGQLNPDWDSSLKEIKTETQISNKQIQKYIDFIFGEKKKFDIEKIIARIVVNSLPKKNDLEKLFINISSKAIFQHIATQQIISNQGFVKATIESGINQDTNLKNPKFIAESGNYVQFGLFSLSLVLNEFKTRFTKEDLESFLKTRIVFENINNLVLSRVLKSYYDEDYLVFSHLSIPLIEKIIREFLRINGGNWIDRNQYHGFQSKTLNEMISDEFNIGIFKEVFGKEIGENIIFYLKIALVEKLGMELRTDLAHGTFMERFLNYQISDLLLHIILIFSLVVNKTSTTLKKC